MKARSKVPMQQFEHRTSNKDIASLYYIINWKHRRFTVIRCSTLDVRCWTL